MSKYEPLTTYLQKLEQTSVHMTFEEIEQVIGQKLPPSAFRHRAWWSNNSTNNVMTNAWLAAGYSTVDVDMTSRKLMFRKSLPSEFPPSVGAGQPEQAKVCDGSAPGMFSRIFGVLKGTVKVAPGTDLTSSTGEEWDAAR